MAVDLVFTKLIFRLRLRSEVRDPYALFSLKTRFREVFRKAACVSDGDCGVCSLKVNCPFQDVFGQGLAVDPEALKRHQKPPLPFIFHPPLVDCRNALNRDMEIGLVVIGAAMGYLPLFCDVVKKLFSGEPETGIPVAEIVGLESEGCSGSRFPIEYESGFAALEGLSTISAEDLIALNTLPAHFLGLRILTPMRIQREGSFLRDFSFSPFFRTLLRRVSSLAYYYYGSVLEMDYPRLAKLSEFVDTDRADTHWTVWRKGALEGIYGNVVLRGELSDFHAVLLLGEYLSCGKGASYGLGHFELTGFP